MEERPLELNDESKETEFLREGPSATKRAAKSAACAERLSTSHRSLVERVDASTNLIYCRLPIVDCRLKVPGKQLHSQNQLPLNKATCETISTQPH